MTEENKPKIEKQEKKTENKNQEIKSATPKLEHKAEAKKEKKESKKVSERPKKEKAFAKGVNIKASKKQCMYLCSFIKNKLIDKAIEDLELVIKFKKPVPFKGEIPHRKGRIMSGRYPVKASGLLIKLLKGLKGNAIVNGLDIDKTKITLASASLASLPARSGNRHAKRTNIILEAKEIV